MFFNTFRRTERGDEHRIPWRFEEHDVLNHWIMWVFHSIFRQPYLALLEHPHHISSGGLIPILASLPGGAL